MATSPTPSSATRIMCLRSSPATQKTITAVITGTSAVPRSATTTMNPSIATAISACLSVRRSLIACDRRDTK